MILTRFLSLKIQSGIFVILLLDRSNTFKFVNFPKESGNSIKSFDLALNSFNRLHSPIEVGSVVIKFSETSNSFKFSSSPRDVGRLPN